MTETLPTTADSEPTDVQETSAPATSTRELALPYYAIRGRLRIRAHATRLFNDGLAAARNARPDLAPATASRHSCSGTRTTPTPAARSPWPAWNPAT